MYQLVTNITNDFISTFSRNGNNTFCSGRNIINKGIGYVLNDIELG